MPQPASSVASGTGWKTPEQPELFSIFLPQPGPSVQYPRVDTPSSTQHPRADGPCTEHPGADGPSAQHPRSGWTTFYSDICEPGHSGHLPHQSNKCPKHVSTGVQSRVFLLLSSPKCDCWGNTPTSDGGVARCPLREVFLLSLPQKPPWALAPKPCSALGVQR